MKEQTPFPVASVSLAGEYDVLICGCGLSSAAAAWNMAARGLKVGIVEYFGKPGADPSRWGKPTAALLGAMQAQLDLGVAAIGGKDSMSGSFASLDVPPTLVSFAVGIGSAAGFVRRSTAR